MLLGHPAVLVGPVQVGVRIGLHGLQLEQITARGLGNVACHRLGIAGSGVVDHQYAAALSALAVLWLGCIRCGGVLTVFGGRGGSGCGGLLLALIRGLAVIGGFTLPAGGQGQSHHCRQGQADQFFPSVFHDQTFLSDLELRFHILLNPGFDVVGDHVVVQLLEHKVGVAGDTLVG